MKKTLIAALLFSAWLAPAASQLPRDLRTDGKPVQSAFAEAATAAAMTRLCVSSAWTRPGRPAALANRVVRQRLPDLDFHSQQRCVLLAAGRRSAPALAHV